MTEQMGVPRKDFQEVTRKHQEKTHEVVGLK